MVTEVSGLPRAVLVVTEVSWVLRAVLMVVAVSRTIVVCADMSKTALVMKRVSRTSSVFVAEAGFAIQVVEYCFDYRCAHHCCGKRFVLSS